MMSNSDPLIFWLIHAVFFGIFAYSLLQDALAGFRPRRRTLASLIGYNAMNRARFIATHVAMALLLLHVIDVAEGIRHKLLLTVIDMSMLAYLAFRSRWWLDRVAPER